MMVRRADLHVRVPVGLLGMIALIVVLETVVASHYLQFTRFYIHDWRVTGQQASTVSQESTMLCFGDSLVKFGVLPRVLEKVSGERVYNLSVCGGQAGSSYFLFRRAIQSGARPKFVLIDFVPHLLSPGPQHNLRQWPELLSVQELMELGITSRYVIFSVETFLRVFLPSLKDREEIRSSLLATLQGRSTPHRRAVEEHERIWRANLGADVHPDRPEYQGEVDTSDPGYFPKRWKCHRTNEFYVHRFMELAEARGIRVIWLLPPVTPRFQAELDERGLSSASDQMIQQLLRKFKNITVLDARDSGFPSRLFVDPLHLNQAGASRLSTAIATSLDQIRLGTKLSDRWLSWREGTSGFGTLSGGDSMASADNDRAFVQGPSR